MARAPMPRITSAAISKPRLRCVASISAPMGMWAAIEVRPPIMATRPMAAWSQWCCVNRKTPRNGPSTAAESARQKLSPSRARLRRMARYPSAVRVLGLRFLPFFRRLRGMILALDALHRLQRGADLVGLHADAVGQGDAFAARGELLAFYQQLAELGIGMPADAHHRAVIEQGAANLALGAVHRPNDHTRDLELAARVPLSQIIV